MTGQDLGEHGIHLHWNPRLAHKPWEVRLSDEVFVGEDFDKALKYALRIGMQVVDARSDLVSDKKWKFTPESTTLTAMVYMKTSDLQEAVILKRPDGKIGMYKYHLIQ